MSLSAALIVRVPPAVSYVAPAAPTFTVRLAAMDVAFNVALSKTSVPDPETAPVSYETK